MQRNPRQAREQPEPQARAPQPVRRQEPALLRDYTAWRKRVCQDRLNGLQAASRPDEAAIAAEIEVLG